MGAVGENMCVSRKLDPFPLVIRCRTGSRLGAAVPVEVDNPFSDWSRPLEVGREILVRTLLPIARDRGEATLAHDTLKAKPASFKARGQNESRLAPIWSAEGYLLDPPLGPRGAVISSTGYDVPDLPPYPLPICIFSDGHVWISLVDTSHVQYTASDAPATAWKLA